MINTKQQALNLFEVTRSEFLENCRWIARKIAEKQGHVTIDDVRNNVTIPLNIDGRVMGAVFNTPEFVKVGYTTTKIKSSHDRPIAVFHLKNQWSEAVKKNLENINQFDQQQILF